MIIDLKAIPREGTRNFEFRFDKDWLNSDTQNDRALECDTPLIVRVEVYRDGDKYAIEGNLEGLIRMMCDRCLNYYHRDIRSDFKLFLALWKPSDTEKPDVELLEDDMEIGFIRDEEIDLDEIIREQLYLSLPIKSLCREDCLGLCPICGSDMNIENCRCTKEEGHPGLSKLKSLVIEGK